MLLQVTLDSDKTQDGVACAPGCLSIRSTMPRAESTHIALDGVEYNVVLHIYGEQDWRGFLIKPGSQVRIPERGVSREEALAKLHVALKKRLH